MELALRAAASVAAAYLLGSLSPSYWLGRALKGIDIRGVGFKNAGTRNALTVLGVWPAVATAIIDTTKGVAALLIARGPLGVGGVMLLLPVASAIAGHLFPFYLRFRGGRGSATAIGVYLFLIGEAMATGRFHVETFSVLLATALAVYLASRTGDVTGMVVFLAMGIVTPFEMGTSAPGIINMALSLFLLVSIIERSIAHGVFRLEGVQDFKLWRALSRPFALLFIPIDLYLHRTFTVLLMTAVAVVFLAIDVVRFTTSVRLRRLYKRSETGRLSSMSLFLVSLLFTFLLFPGIVPYFSLVFAAMGDLGAKLIGMRYGRTILLPRRTLEGLLGFFGVSLISAYILSLIFPISLPLVILGSLFAALVELTTGGFDNLALPLLSGGFLTILRSLGVP